MLRDGPNILNHLRTMTGLDEDDENVWLLVSIMPWIKTTAPEFQNVLAPDNPEEVLAELVSKLIMYISAQQKTVIIFDDAQWYDPMTSKVVQQVAVRQLQNPLASMAMVIASRTPLKSDFNTIKDKGSPYMLLKPLENVADTFSVMMMKLGIKQDTWGSFLEKYHEFADVVHQATAGVPGMIRSCAQTMHDDGTIKSSAKTFRLMCPLDDVPIFKAFHTKNVAKFLSLDKDDQLVLKYAALIGTDFDNNLLKSCLTKGGMDDERINNLLGGLVQNGILVRSPDSQLISFASQSTANAITSTMLNQQKMQFCTRLSNLMGIVKETNDVEATMKRFEMALSFSEAMAMLGHNRLGRTLLDYGHFAKGKETANHLHRNIFT